MNVLLVLSFLSSIAAQSFPSYYDGRVFTYINASSQYTTPIKIVSSSKEYSKKNSKRDNYLQQIMGTEEISIPSNKYDPTNIVPTNATGTYHRVKFNQGIITYLEVLDEFNFDGNRTVPVQICTSWYGHDSGESLDHVPGELTKAIAANSLLNMTMFVDWAFFTQNETDAVNEGRVWEVDEYLCFYDGSSAWINAFGKCVIPYSEIINQYLILWEDNDIPVAVNGERTRVTNDLDFVENFICGITGQKQCINASFEAIHYVPSASQFLNAKAIDDPIWYQFDTKPAALGHSVNTTYGYNRFKKTYDVNFTILFNNWTFDMPIGLLQSYRDFSFNYENMYLIINYWVEDDPPKPDRDIPGSFWVMAVIMIAPTTVLVLAAILLLLTRSRKSFNLNLWKFKKEMKRAGTKAEIKQSNIKKAIERHEERRRNELLEEGNDVIEMNYAKDTTFEK